MRHRMLNWRRQRRPQGRSIAKRIRVRSSFDGRGSADTPQLRFCECSSCSFLRGLNFEGHRNLETEAMDYNHRFVSHRIATCSLTISFVFPFTGWATDSFACADGDFEKRRHFSAIQPLSVQFDLTEKIGLLSRDRTSIRTTPTCIWAEIYG
jgi:hypothetical protein